MTPDMEEVVARLEAIVASVDYARANAMASDGESTVQLATDLRALLSERRKMVKALTEARHWHDSRRDDLGKQPPGGDRDWRRMEHADEIARIDAALTGSREHG